jgi:hypothetical protein
MTITYTSSVFKNVYGETLLTSLFFSRENISNVQILLRRRVFNITSISIDNQSLTDLLVIMRSIFLTYSNHPLLIEEDMSKETKEKLFKEYTSEVARLNDMVVDTASPIIVTYLKQYVVYDNYINNPLPIMDKPIASSIKGQRSLGGDLRI